jgi:hypothetical protein
MEIIEMERRRREFAENTCRGRGWTEAQCAEVLAGVTIDLGDGRLSFHTAGLSADHPLRQRTSGQYPVHQHMMVMGRGDAPSYHHQQENLAPVEIPSYRLDPRAEVLDRPRTIGVDLGACDTSTIGYWRRAGLKPLQFNRIRPRPDPLAAMTCHRDTHTLEERKAPQFVLLERDESVPNGWRHAEPAKPVLHVPEGCKLIVPFGFDLSPYEVRVDGSLGFEPAGAVTVMTVSGGAKPAPRGLTFEQPIQNRLGRMAR